MALTKLTATLNKHQSLADDPALSSTNLKIAWDTDVNTVKTFINDTLTAEQDVINATIPTYALTSGTAAKTAEEGSDGDVYLRYS